MASYNTLPVAANPEEVLLQKPKKASLRYLVGAAALAAFVLGAVSATAVKTSPGLDSQKWQIGDAPEPPSPAFKCPWKKDKPCASDSDCVWVGGKNTCSKCHKNPGQRSICGPIGK